MSEKFLICFEASLKKDILNMFNKEVDSEGYVVEKDNPKQRVLSCDRTEMTVDEFGGITKGSEVFIKGDLPSLIKFSKR